jgi:hypothetical protein
LELLPCLIRLENFVGGFDPISSMSFKLLAEAAGTTLVTISNLRVSDQDTILLDRAVFTLFTRVTRIDFRELPRLLPCSDTLPQPLGTDRSASPACVFELLSILH